MPDWDLERVYVLEENFCDLLWLVFLDYVPAVVDHDHAVFAHHMGDRQFFVHAVGAREQQLLLDSDLEEALGEALEPPLPVGLRGEQIRAPHVAWLPSSLIDTLDNLSRHRDPRTCLVAHLARRDTILDDRGEIGELGWTVVHNRVHDGERLHSCAFDYVDDEEALHLLLELVPVHFPHDLVSSLGSDRSTHRMADHDYRAVGVAR